MKELTKEKALELHRQMWSDMKEELGDNPSFKVRLKFKEEWCKDNGFVNITADCFLCEYDIQHNTDPFSCNCLINWEPLTGRSGCCVRVKNDGYSYKNAPISKILALPERKVEG